ncbi:uncharacterized protein LOC125489342 [Plutella xylostella]|uniref:uncharacterized protein LOC125489342 n=1 Tax=Plutella xylostella TaxID=51655 RepID=UPI002032381E|nr:uncharacterized protein LOC125489342 [Plutella xylostella]
MMFDEWKETQHTLLNKLVSDVADIKKQNKDIIRSNEEIEKSMSMINCMYEEMKKKVETLEADRKQSLLHIASLESKLEDMQRVSKASCFEIRNVPFPENHESKAELSDIVHKTGKALQVAVDKTNIRDVYRLNGKSGKGTIIAELTSVVLKNDVMKAAKAHNKQHSDRRLCAADIGYKGLNTPVYISEALTNKARRLFFLARDFAKNQGYKFCWTSNGRVFLRKTPDSPHIEIKEESQLMSMSTPK